MECHPPSRREHRQRSGPAVSAHVVPISDLRVASRGLVWGAVPWDGFLEVVAATAVGNVPVG